MIEHFKKREDVLALEGFKELDKFLKTKKIGFDIDGTEASIAHKALEKFNEKYEQDKKNSDFTKVFAMVSWMEELGMKHPHKASGEIWDDKEVLSNALPVGGALLFSRHINSLGISAQRITSRPSFAKQWTYDWYEKYMPWVSKENIHIQKSGDHVNHDHKTKRIKELGIEIFFEDNPKHAVDIVDKTNAIVVMVPWPWNISSTPEHERIIKPWEFEHYFDNERPEMFRSIVALAKHNNFI